MKFKLSENGAWYHGSNMRFDILREGSTITQWKELAEAFSRKPSTLSYNDSGEIFHNGTEKGYLYIIDESITVGIDIYKHPHTAMENHIEFLTASPLRVKLISKL